MRLGRPPFVAVQTAIWTLTTVAGLMALTHYSSTPGETAAAPGRWPIDVDVPRGEQQPTLVMFLHPHCACSQASLHELARIAARCRRQMQLRVLLVRPAGCSPDWHKTDLLARAAAIPGVSVAVDQDGQRARQFGAKTSGQTIVYDRHGSLLFNGGITAGRGHEGDNPGQSAVISIAEGLAGVPQTECGTFGCPLFANTISLQ
jgi:hypothetical protein